MTQAPPGAQARIAPHHRAHQFVGVQTTFHQSFGAPGTHFRDRFLGPFLAEGRVDDWVAVNVESGLLGDFPDARRGADQNRRNQTGLGASTAPVGELSSQR